MKPLSLQFVEGTPKAHEQAIIYSLYEAIFGEKPLLKVAQRLAQMPDLLTIIAYFEETPIGYKIGYAESDTCFYSWIGGVLPTYRGCGAATALMEAQHEWCLNKGYTHVKTKTMNRWREMLLLNLKKGFEIMETYPGDDGQLRIILVKEL
jgi:GNAT superfamily N-acetyltransferase